MFSVASVDLSRVVQGTFDYILVVIWITIWHLRCVKGFCTERSMRSKRCPSSSLCYFIYLFKKNVLIYFSG